MDRRKVPFKENVGIVELVQRKTIQIIKRDLSLKEFRDIWLSLEEVPCNCSH